MISIQRQQRQCCEQRQEQFCQPVPSIPSPPSIETTTSLMLAAEAAVATPTSPTLRRSMVLRSSSEFLLQTEQELLVQQRQHQRQQRCCYEQQQLRQQCNCCLPRSPSQTHHPASVSMSSSVAAASSPSPFLNSITSPGGLAGRDSDIVTLPPPPPHAQVQAQINDVPPQVRSQRQRQADSIVTAASVTTSSDTASPQFVRHERIMCDNCYLRGIIGTRYRCTVCQDYDLCEECYLQDRPYDDFGHDEGSDDEDEDGDEVYHHVHSHVFERITIPLREEEVSSSQSSSSSPFKRRRLDCIFTNTKASSSDGVEEDIIPLVAAIPIDVPRPNPSLAATRTTSAEATTATSACIGGSSSGTKRKFTTPATENDSCNFQQQQSSSSSSTKMPSIKPNHSSSATTTASADNAVAAFVDNTSLFLPGQRIRLIGLQSSFQWLNNFEGVIHERRPNSNKIIVRVLDTSTTTTTTTTTAITTTPSSSSSPYHQGAASNRKNVVKVVDRDFFGVDSPLFLAVRSYNLICIAKAATTKATLPTTQSHHNTKYQTRLD